MAMKITVATIYWALSVPDSALQVLYTDTQFSLTMQPKYYCPPLLMNVETKAHQVKRPT